MAIRLMGDGSSESMIRVSIGSKEDFDTQNTTNIQQYTFWLDDLQPGDRFVQGFDYAGQTYHIVIENWTYTDPGGGNMNDTISPFQKVNDSSYETYPLTQSL